MENDQVKEIISWAYQIFLQRSISDPELDQQFGAYEVGTNIIVIIDDIRNSEEAENVKIQRKFELIKNVFSDAVSRSVEDTYKESADIINCLIRLKGVSLEEKDRRKAIDFLSGGGSINTIIEEYGV